MCAGFSAIQAFISLSTTTFLHLYQITYPAILLRDILQISIRSKTKTSSSLNRHSNSRSYNLHLYPTALLLRQPPLSIKPIQLPFSAEASMSSFQTLGTLLTSTRITATECKAKHPQRQRAGRALSDNNPNCSFKFAVPIFIRPSTKKERIHLRWWRKIPKSEPMIEGTFIYIYTVYVYIAIRVCKTWRVFISLAAFLSRYVIYSK